MIEVSGISKSFYRRGQGRLLSVDDVSFKCLPGEVYGLLGPNGAGKTTSLLIASTLMNPDTGKVIIDGRDALTDIEEARRSIGFMSPVAQLYDLLTPRELLFFVARLFGYSEPELSRRVALLISMFGLENIADTRCKGFSTGMRQRVSLARAMVHDPPVLILDEPTVGLDVVSCHALEEIILRCRDQGKCIIFSTHVMSEAEKLCDRIGIINGGRLLIEGTVEQLKDLTGAGTLEKAFLHAIGR